MSLKIVNPNQPALKPCVNGRDKQATYVSDYSAYSSQKYSDRSAARKQTFLKEYLSRHRVSDFPSVESNSSGSSSFLNSGRETELLQNGSNYKTLKDIDQQYIGPGTYDTPSIFSPLDKKKHMNLMQNAGAALML